jgi:hypothetical protein
MIDNRHEICARASYLAAVGDSALAADTADSVTARDPAMSVAGSSDETPHKRPAVC